MRVAFCSTLLPSTKDFFFRLYVFFPIRSYNEAICLKRAVNRWVSGMKLLCVSDCVFEVNVPKNRHIQRHQHLDIYTNTRHISLRDKTTRGTHLLPALLPFFLSYPPVKEQTNVTLINIDKDIHEMSSRMEKWTRPWREIESRMESEAECKCFDDQGQFLSGEGQKTDIMHLDSSLISSVITLLPSLCVSPSPSHSSRPSITFSRSFSTVEYPKWQHIKHLGTEAPRVLIKTLLASKMIISRREWVLDGWWS